MSARVLAVAIAVAALVPALAAAATPTIAVQPTSSPPGRLVTVTGRGFCAAAACSPVRLFVFGNPVGEPVQVAADGSFVARVRVPGVTSPEENGVSAVQQLASGAQSTAFADFPVVLRIAPSKPPPPKQAPPTRPRTTETTATAPSTAEEEGETAPPPGRTGTGSDEVPTTPADTETTSPAGSPAPRQPGGTDGDGDGLPWLLMGLLGGLVLALAAAGAALARARRAT